MFQNGGVNLGFPTSTFSAFLQPNVCQMSVKIVINEVIFYNFTFLSSVITEVLTGSENAVFTGAKSEKALDFSKAFGDPTGTRTPNRLLRREVLYPVEL